MPLTLRRGRVSAILERHEGLVRLEVDGVACVAYPLLTGPVAMDDDVLVNAQARAPRELRRARDEAPVHAAPVRRATRGRGRRARRADRRDAGRGVFAPQPG